MTEHQNSEEGAEGLTEAERARWDIDPNEWPHTPPHNVFRALYENDDNLWWRAGSGHGQNAYDAALEEIDDLRAALASPTSHAQREAEVDPGCDIHRDQPRACYLCL